MNNVQFGKDFTISFIVSKNCKKDLKKYRVVRITNRSLNDVDLEETYTLPTPDIKDEFGNILTPGVNGSITITDKIDDKDVISLKYSLQEKISTNSWIDTNIFIRVKLIEATNKIEILAL